MLSGDMTTTDEIKDNAINKMKEPPSDLAIKKEYKRQMLSSLCNLPLDLIDENAELKRLLSFGVDEKLKASTTTRIRHEDPYSHDILRVLDQFQSDKSILLRSHKSAMRRVPEKPWRILDLPGVVDDYYLDLVSWSKYNILAVGLGSTVYLYNPVTKRTDELTTLEEEVFEGQRNYVTSVAWCTRPGVSEYLAIGTNLGSIQLWDCQAMQPIFQISRHKYRVGSIAWNEHWLTSGGRDSQILLHDLRSTGHLVSTFKAHTQEIVGLKWSEDGRTLASGGNDDSLCIWDAAMSSSRQSGSQVIVSPRLILREHTAAVKALDWCPFRPGLLASGGGTRDRTIKLWNTNSGEMLTSVDTKSQVSGVIWSKHQQELCSSHGFTRNGLVLWKYGNAPDELKKVTELTGHTARVLCMSSSPDGSSVVSASGDETLRFWNIFGAPSRRRYPSVSAMGELTFGSAQIR
jgi:cell division cycle protein 20 (cofactor of APC complex)